MYRIKLFKFGESIRFLHSLDTEGFDFNFGRDNALTFDDKLEADNALAYVKKLWPLGPRDSLSLETPDEDDNHRVFSSLLLTFVNDRAHFADRLYSLGDPADFVDWLGNHHPEHQKQVILWVTRTI